MAWRRSRKRACSTPSVRRATNISQLTRPIVGACRGKCRSCQEKNGFSANRRDTLGDLAKQTYTYATHHLVDRCRSNRWWHRRVSRPRPPASRFLEIGASRYRRINYRRLDRTFVLETGAWNVLPPGGFHHVDHMCCAPSVHLAKNVRRRVDS